MQYRLLVLSILLLSCFHAVAQSMSLRIHGSNTVGAQLAPALIQTWLNSNDYQSIQIRQRDEESIVQAKALAISDGEAPAIEPNSFSVATEDYALSRRLYLYLPNLERINPLAQQFIDYVHSNAAQDVIEKVGFVSQRVFTGTYEANEQYPDELRKLAQGAKRLSINMRFFENTVFLDNKAKRDAERVYSYLEARNKLQRGILLFGFTEQKPDGLPMINYNRSVRRADQVGKYLREKGVLVVTSRGYGSAVPVASNETELGQAKNRRVELWLK